MYQRQPPKKPVGSELWNLGYKLKQLANGDSRQMLRIQSFGVSLCSSRQHFFGNLSRNA